MSNRTAPNRQQALDALLADCQQAGDERMVRLIRLIAEPDEVIYMADIKAITGLSEARIYALRAEGSDLPVRKRKFGAKLYALRHELTAWVQGRSAPPQPEPTQPPVDPAHIRQQLQQLLDLRRRGWADDEALLNAEIARLTDTLFAHEEST